MFTKDKGAWSVFRKTSAEGQEEEEEFLLGLVAMTAIALLPPKVIVRAIIRETIRPATTLIALIAQTVIAEKGRAATEAIAQLQVHPNVSENFKVGGQAVMILIARRARVVIAIPAFVAFPLRVTVLGVIRAMARLVTQIHAPGETPARVARVPGARLYFVLKAGRGLIVIVLGEVLLITQYFFLGKTAKVEFAPVFVKT